MEGILAVFGIQWHHIIIQIVNFSIVIVALRFLLYRPVLSLLKKRQQRVTESLAVLEQADHAQKETEVTRERIIKEAYDRSETIARQAKESAQKERNELLAATERERNAALKKQREHLEQERAQMLRDVEKETAKIAILATEKLLRKKS